MLTRYKEERSLEDQLDAFKKSLDDLDNIDVKISDEDKVIILINDLPKVYDNLKDDLPYGCSQTLSIEDVTSSLKI